ncbi:MAG: DNA double-strand break repair nuclease NurA [Candidatus Heimdallarchaeota archaeon]|nr:DNA double-strand break repair nuclease NurA [Candidatus Heimdallarchaeota archaeon]
MAVQNKVDKAIDDISKRIKKYNEHRKLFQELFREVKDSLNPSEFPPAFGIKTSDTLFTEKVPKTNIEGLKFAGVDGGVIHRSLNYFDIALIRAVGVLFFHRKETKPIVKYFPEEQPFPDILTSIEPLSQKEIESLISIWRMQKEIRCGISLIEEDLPDIIMLDGSVLPVVDIRQVNQSEFLLSQYRKLKALYRRLYTLCQKNRTALCGIVKDSRSAVLTSKLSGLLPHLSKVPEFQKLLKIDYRPIIRQLRDTDLLYHVLDINERTFEFFLSNFNDESDKDLPNFNIHCFYLKTAEYDTPLRVEYPLLFSNQHDHAQTISSLVNSVSRFNPEYGLPNVIIEADARARLQETDADILVDEIAAKIGYTGFSLQKRRNRSPFASGD